MMEYTIELVLTVPPGLNKRHHVNTNNDNIPENQSLTLYSNIPQADENEYVIDRILYVSSDIA